MNSPQWPASWHRVPNTNLERYWDGTRWTDAYRPLAPPAVYQTTFDVAPTSGLAISSMVLGICSFFLPFLGIGTGITGLILGFVGVPQCLPRGTKQGRGMAIAGIVCSIVATLFWFFLIVVIILTADSGPVNDY